MDNQKEEIMLANPDMLGLKRLPKDYRLPELPKPFKETLFTAGQMSEHARAAIEKLLAHG